MKKLLPAAPVLLLIAACASTASQAPRSGKARGTELDGDDDYDRAATAYWARALAPLAERQKARTALLPFLIKRAAQPPRHGVGDALEPVRDLAFLAEPSELWGPALLDRPMADALEQAALAAYAMQARAGSMSGTVLSLGILATVKPDPWRARFDQHVQWMREFDLGGEPGTPIDRLLEAHELAVHVFPAPVLVESLARLYRAARDPQPGGLGANAEAMARFRAAHGVGDTARAIARAYLRAEQPDKARTAIAPLSGLPDDDPTIRKALDRIAGGQAAANEWIELAAYLASNPTRRMSDLQRDEPRGPGLEREAALRLCLLGHQRLPDPDLPQCAAEIAINSVLQTAQSGVGPERHRMPMVVTLLERVVARAPDRKQPTEILASLYMDRISMQVSDEDSDLADVEREARRVVDFLGRAQKRVKERLDVDASQVWAALGRGYYERGDPRRAVALLEQAVKSGENMEARERLGLIRLKQGKTSEALRWFEDALARSGGKTYGDLISRARVRRYEGDAWDRQGQPEQARTAREGAREAWTQVANMLGSSQPRRDRAVAEALVERGRASYLIGQPEDAMRDFDQAIAVAPNRGETYADLIAFLAPRGDLATAGRIYRAGMSRPDRDLTEYMKIYSSIWLLDNARRLGQPPEPLAESYLRGLDGKRWQHALARFATGRIGERELSAEADSPAKQVELDFYAAMRLISAGKPAEARDRLKRVVESSFLGFFEFDMAEYFLRFGAGQTQAAVPAKAI